MSHNVKATMSLPEEVFLVIQSELTRLVGKTVKVPLDTDLLEWLLEEAPRVDREMCRTISSGPECVGELGKSTLDPVRDILDVVVPLMLTDPNRMARLVRLVRSGLLVAYKANYESTDEKRNAAFAAFFENDRDLVSVGARIRGLSACERFPEGQQMVYPPPPPTGGDWWKYLDCAAQMIQRLVRKAEAEPHLPKHGPGAVFPQRFQWEKGRFDPSRVAELEDMLGIFDDSLEPSVFRAVSLREIPLSKSRANILWTAMASEFSPGGPVRPPVSVPTRQRASERRKPSRGITKLIAVPKDARGPRLICVHSAEAQWMQQAYRSALESAMKKVSPFCDMIDLNDQFPSQEAAREGSISGKFATLDLKDASDRVCRDLVQLLFGSGYFADVNKCCAGFVLHDGEQFPLEKFAPMGNALTFPVQSVIYGALALACYRLDPRYTPEWGHPRIFGDDIIVRTEVVETLIGLLEWCGLKVNSNKSYWTGYFREACGFDGLGGLNVTPIRLRVCKTDQLLDLASAQSYIHEVWKAGYKKLGRELYARLINRTTDALWEGRMSWTCVLKLARETSRSRSTTINTWEEVREFVRHSLFVRINNPDTSCFCQLVDDQDIDKPTWNGETQSFGWRLPASVDKLPTRRFDQAHHIDESLWELARRPHVREVGPGGPIIATRAKEHQWESKTVRRRKKLTTSYVMMVTRPWRHGLVQEIQDPFCNS